MKNFQFFTVTNHRGIMQTNVDLFEKVFDRVYDKLKTGDGISEADSKQAAAQVALKLVEFEWQMSMFVLQAKAQGVDLTRGDGISIARGPLR